MTELKLPPLRTLLKSSEVEDPINIHVHRPAAYYFVKAIWRTPMTPNMITLLSVIVGASAGALFLWGTPAAMFVGGWLVWTAAILDGADGILARAKKMQSQFGRALDGWADMMVAIVTVFPAFYHVWLQHHSTLHLALMGPAVLLTTVHLSLYDYYKESYLRMTRPDGRGEGEDYEDAAKRVEAARAKGVMTYIAVKHVLLPYLQQQDRLIRWLNPLSDQLRRMHAEDQRAADIYRKHNLGPMRLFTAVSLAPHSYLLAWCAMADQLAVYLWIRVALMNVVFFTALFWQRRATRLTLEELGALPRKAPAYKAQKPIATDTSNTAAVH